MQHFPPKNATFSNQHNFFRLVVLDVGLVPVRVLDMNFFQAKV